MPKTPPIPKEQRSLADVAGTDEDNEVARDPGTHAERNLGQQGRQGNIAQNTTHQGIPRPRGG